MKLVCSRKELFEAVSAAAGAASSRTPATILQDVRIEAGDGHVRIVGCDGEMWVERSAACVVEEQGSVCLLAKLLSEILGKLPEGPVELVSGPTSAVLKQGESVYTLQIHEALDFPDVPDLSPENSLTLPMGQVRKAVESVAYAVSTDSHRAALTGVLFRYDGQTLTLVATDTHRLAVRRIQQAGLGSSLEAIVAEKTLKAIREMPVSDDTDVTLNFDRSRVGVSAGGARVVSQILSGAYPNWERVVPDESTRKWKLELDQLKEKVSRAMILAKDNSNRVRFRGIDEEIQIMARSEERGSESKEMVPMLNVENGNVEIAFNGKYVLDALGPVPGPGLQIEMTESSRPAIFRPVDEEVDYFCVIMPMQLQ